MTWLSRSGRATSGTETERHGGSNPSTARPELPLRNTADRQHLYWEALGWPPMWEVRVQAAVAAEKAKLKLGTSREMR